jgi:hypothetical protein
MTKPAKKLTPACNELIFVYMKTLASLITVFLLSAGFAAAQDLSGLNATTNHTNGQGDLTGYKYVYQPGYNPTTAKAAPDPKVVLKPQLGGVFVDGAKYGWTIISPAAPVTWGNGEKYMSAPDPRYDLMHEAGPAAHRDSGGIKLFSLEF